MFKMLNGAKINSKTLKLSNKLKIIPNGIIPFTFYIIVKIK